MAEQLRALIEDSDSSDEDYSPRRPRWIKERNNYFEDIDDIDFVKRFRLSKRATLFLLNKIDHQLEYDSDRNFSISPINQLSGTLRFYATNNTQMCVGDFCGLSTSTAHRIIHRVSSAIAALHKDFIKFPKTSQEIRTEQDKFYHIARFPRVVGAMDCTHVHISSPGGDQAELFRNRKGYFSINVQTICNANLEITDIVARWPGGSHDSHIYFNNCYRKAKFEMGSYGNALLLVDGGYASNTYMMPPLENPRTPAEQLYNESQIRTRNPVERSYGVWKQRFPVLALGMRIKLNKALVVIIATAVLHNMLRQQKEITPPDDPDVILPVIPGTNRSMSWEQLLEHGQMDLSNDFYNNIDITRNAMITDYFQGLV